MDKKLDGNYTRILRAILNSWRQHPTKQQLYGHLPPSRKLSKLDKPGMQDIAGEMTYSFGPLKHDRAKAGRQSRTYIQQLCENMGCSLEDLPEAVKDREGWRERVRDIRADGMAWWWWYLRHFKIFFPYNKYRKFAKKDHI